jgi:hypothetical protein
MGAIPRHHEQARKLNSLPKFQAVPRISHFVGLLIGRLSNACPAAVLVRFPLRNAKGGGEGN